jgi:hypothetical protein
VLLVFPVVVGAGKRLFESGRGAIGLKLTDTRVFTNGVVKLVYAPNGQ